MNTPKLFGSLLLLIVCVGIVTAWDQEELEIFDLVEEINENFYTVLKVQQVIEGFYYDSKRKNGFNQF